MSKTNTFLLGGKPLPLDLTSLVAEEDGQALALAEGVTKFDFAYRLVRFAAQLEMAAGKAELRLVGDLGPMPFSAESPAARAGLVRIAEAACDHLGGQVLKVTHGRILLGGTMALPAPVTATSLVTEVTRFLMPALPYMELVALYIRPPLLPRKRGESALRPEWRRVGISVRGR